MKKLKSLNEFNGEQLLRHVTRRIEPGPNGIACPVCNTELWDTNPTVTLTSNPAQKNIHCPSLACGYRGYRTA